MEKNITSGPRFPELYQLDYHLLLVVLRRAEVLPVVVFVIAVTVGLAVELVLAVVVVAPVAADLG